MSEIAWSMRQQKRLLRARFPPPGAAAAGWLVVIVSVGLPAWYIYNSSALPWPYALFAGVFLGVAIMQLITISYEPLAATLRDELERRSDRPNGIHMRSLSRWERRRIASARIDPSAARLLAGINLLFGVGMFVAWFAQVRSPRFIAAVEGLLVISAMVFGYGLIEYVRWETLIAALRTDLGPEHLRRLIKDWAIDALPAARGLTPAQKERIRSAPGPRRLWLVAALGVLGSGAEIIFAWLAWRVVASPGLFLLACCALVVTSSVAGYAAAAARWQPLAAALVSEPERERREVLPHQGQDGSDPADGGDPEGPA